MKVKWLGHSCFLVISKGGVRIITDPYAVGGGINYSPIKEPADIVVVTHGHDDHSNVSAVQGEPEVVRGDGTKTARGIQFRGVASYHDDSHGAQRGPNTIFCFTIDDINLCHLGDLGHPLDSHLIEEIGDIGILFLPVGEVSTIPIDTAVEIVRQLEPPIVIPMHYKTEAFTGNLSPVDKFLDKMRIRELEAKPKLSITSSSLPSSTQTIALNHL